MKTRITEKKRKEMDLKMKVVQPKEENLLLMVEMRNEISQGSSEGNSS